jgi:signal transduction protein with GAF and PtsI domain
VSAGGDQAPLTELLASLADGAADGTEERLDVLARRAAQLCGADAASILVHPLNGAETAHAASSPLSERAVEVELRDGDGPIGESRATGRPVVLADLRHERRWPAVVPTFDSLGIGSLVAVPLALGALHVGTLVLVSGGPRRFESEELDRIIHVADLVTQLVLGLQQLGDGERLGTPLVSAADRRAVVHQAVGMVAVQLDCRLDESLARLRAHAFAVDRSVADVARAVVARDLRFDR